MEDEFHYRRPVSVRADKNVAKARKIVHLLSAQLRNNELVVDALTRTTDGLADKKIRERNWERKRELKECKYEKAKL